MCPKGRPAADAGGRADTAKIRQRWAGAGAGEIRVGGDSRADGGGV